MQFRRGWVRCSATEESSGQPVHTGPESASARLEPGALTRTTIRSGAVMIVRRTVVAAPTLSAFHRIEDTPSPPPAQQIW